MNLGKFGNSILITKGGKSCIHDDEDEVCEMSASEWANCPNHYDL